jgi:superfamily I DNA/RNA helicase
MDCIEGITPKCKENDEEDPEELRCMYVACTRAKEELLNQFIKE